jgi:high mobility group protein B3
MARQKKDVNAPKRPLSAYIIYCQEQRESLKKKNPDMKATELTSQLGSMWKALSDDKKKQYLTKHEKERERYQREMKDYTPPQKEEEREEKTSRRKSKKDVSSSRPKRAPSGYIIFCQDRRAEVKEENPSYGPKQITSRLGELWRELDDDTKAEYTQRSRDLSSRNSSHQEEEEAVEVEEEVEEQPQKKEKAKKQRRGGKRRQQEDEEDLEDE